MNALPVALRIVAALMSYPSVGGAIPPNAVVIESVEWIAGDPRPTPSPRCIVLARRWACWGISPRTPGVVILHAPDMMWWGVTGREEPQALRPARWARLLLVSNAPPPPAELRLGFRRPIAPPAARFRAFRLDTGPVSGASATPVTATAFWLAGDAVPPESWMEIQSDRASPAYLALPEITAAPVSLPLHVTLHGRRVIEGRAVVAGDRPAPGTLITVFRLIDPVSTEKEGPAPRRVLAAELIADENGRFELQTLGEADYEAVAWHGQLGRGVVSIGRSDIGVVVSLRSAGIARGRVLSAGTPIEGVDVVSVPDAAAFSAAADMTDVKGGDTRTAADGRFAVPVAASGGGELRVGGGAFPVKRIRLPRPPLPLFDAGDIDLGRAIDLVVLIDAGGRTEDSGCALTAAGPIGRTGLQVVSAQRTAPGTFAVAIPEPGAWEFSLRCRTGGRVLSPAVVQIAPAQAGKEVTLRVRD